AWIGACNALKRRVDWSVTTRGQHLMTNDDKTRPLARVDRETASKLNPAISDVCISGTLEQVTGGMGVLSMYVATAEGMDDDSFSLLSSLLAAALDDEAQQDEAQPQTSEAAVKRVK
ncbi:MAG: hypothetical protein ACREXR_09190, partial [Gammaproteobacteria bacterium]